MKFEQLKSEILKIAISQNACDRETVRIKVCSNKDELIKILADNASFVSNVSDLSEKSKKLGIKKDIYTGVDNSGIFNSGNRNSGDLNSGDLNSGNRNSGDRNSGDRNSGDRNSGDLNSGDRNSGDLNSGDRNSGDLNSGNLNSGNLNSGNRNSGNLNSGNRNSGDLNSGDLNSGNRNSGNLNSGNRNSGDLNSGDRNSGVFCNNKRDDKILFFNRKSSMSWADWYSHPASRASSKLNLTKWIEWGDMSDVEKKDNPDAYVIGGYLKTFDYKEAWLNLWSELSSPERESFKTLPNFDSDIFEEITGIKIK